MIIKRERERERERESRLEHLLIMKINELEEPINE